MAENMNELIKRIAMAALEESKPVAIIYGEVTGTDPLEITVDQKLKLSEDFLLLTNAVCDHYVYMTVDHTTDIAYLDANHSHTASSTFEGDVSTTIKNKVDPSSTKVESTAETTMNGRVETKVQQVQIPLNHSHGYTGRKKFLVHNGLKKSEKVILLRCHNGQRFLVLDRVVN